jgi:hypothetical protein
MCCCEDAVQSVMATFMSHAFVGVMIIFHCHVNMCFCYTVSKNHIIVNNNRHT